MILSLFSKNWKLLIDIVIVLGIIFLIFWWNPFNLFGSKLELQGTANVVSKVRDIGELVTAEYYGEVLASDEEARKKVLNTDSIQRLGEEHYMVIKQELMRRYVYRQNLLKEELKKLKRKKDRDKLKASFAKDSRKRIVRNAYPALIEMLPAKFIRNSTILFVGHYEHGTKIKDKKFIKRDDDDHDRYIEKIWKDVLELEYDLIKRQFDKDPEFRNYDQMGFRTNASYVDFYFHYSRLEQPKKERKIKLAMIGRGSVQAGFRFDQLGENNVVYDDRNQTVYFFGFQAEILSTDINPWFIPERRIPGFEILKEEDAKFRHVRELKMHCIDKLRENAMAADILDQAQKNGEEAMKEFFMLILGEEVKRVVFKKESLPHFEKQLLEDSVISWSEVAIIDSLLTEQLQAIQNEEVEAVKERRLKLARDLISKLKQYPLVLENGAQFDFNYTTKTLAGAMRDSLVTRDELEKIVSRIRLNPSIHKTFPVPTPDMKLWYDQELDYLSEFNHRMDILLTNRPVTLEEITERSAILPADSSERVEVIQQASAFVSKNDSTFYQIIGAEIKYFKMRSATIPKGILYPISETTDLETHAMKAKKWRSIISMDTIQLPGFTELSVVRDTALYSSHAYDSIFTDWSDEHLTLVLQDSSFMVMQDTIVLNSMKLAELTSPTSLDMIADSTARLEGYSLEIKLIRDYLKKNAKKERNLGPVMRLRRDFDRWVGNDSTGTISSVRKKVKGWRERLR